MFNTLLFALAALVSTTPVHSSPDTEVVVRRVSYADLDLSTEAGRATLKRRVDAAVRRVCGELESGAPSDYSQCRTQALARANPQVASAVTQYNSRNQLALNGR